MGIWINDFGDDMTHVDEDTGAVLANFPTPLNLGGGGGANGLTYHQGTDRVWYLQQDSPSIVGHFEEDGTDLVDFELQFTSSNVSGIAWKNDELWIIRGTDLVRVDSTTGDDLDTVGPLDTGAYLDWDGSHLWVAITSFYEGIDSGFAKVDTDGSFIEVIEKDDDHATPRGLVIDDGFIWSILMQQTSPFEWQILKMDTSGNTISTLDLPDEVGDPSVIARSFEIPPSVVVPPLRLIQRDDGLHAT